MMDGKLQLCFQTVPDQFSKKGKERIESNLVGFSHIKETDGFVILRYNAHQYRSCPATDESSVGCSDELKLLMVPMDENEDVR